MITPENSHWLLVGSIIGTIIAIAILIWGYWAPLKKPLIKRGIIMNKDKDDKQTNIIKDTEIKAKVKHAKEATALDIDKADTELSNVKVKLEAEDVEKATAMKVTGSGGDAVMSIHMMQCSNCSRRFSKVFTGHLPEETACPHCGHMNKVEK